MGSVQKGDVINAVPLGCWTGRSDQSLHPGGVATSAGMRFPDIGVFDEFGDIIQYIEVKFGKSKYTDSQ